jgi:hypothetical protein
MHMTDASGLRQIKHDNEMWAPLFATKRKIFVALPLGGGEEGVDILFNVIEFNWQAGNRQLSVDTICIYA